MRRFDVTVNGVIESVDESLLTFQNDGRVYKHYNADMSLDLTNVKSGLKARRVAEIKSTTNASANVEVNGITYNGGDSSAAAIAGAVTLSKALGTTEVGIWDINDETTIMDILEAESLAIAIGKKYAEIMYLRQQRITAVNAVNESTIADTETAIDSI